VVACVERGCAAGGVRDVAAHRAGPPPGAGLLVDGDAPAAEFNKSHLPALLLGEPARDYVGMYPFVRSYEWYLLPDEERREPLAEHDRMAREQRTCGQKQ
jgi:hypothetical protein